MEAMIFAAGAGTRLRPLTDRIPKALVEVHGRPMLARVLDRLMDIGVTRVIVNVHHREAQIRTFLSEYRTPDIDIAISPEPDGPYDTGGGLFAAAPLFSENRPFLIHNVDVISSVSTHGLLWAHAAAIDSPESAPVATLAVMSRDAERRLIFDDLGLMGWENTGSDRAPVGSHLVRDAVGSMQSMAFTGIHMVDPKIFSLSERKGTFSIVTLYLELAAAGHKILPYDASGCEWYDIGTPEQLAEAERRLAERQDNSEHRTAGNFGAFDIE
jgi:NDP-sugar pyrophosphorylase family protein